MTDHEQPAAGVALTKASEVLSLIAAATNDPIIAVLRRAGTPYAVLTEVAYAVIADRKDRAPTDAGGAVSEAAFSDRVQAALKIMRERALELTLKHGNPYGTDYEQGVNDHGHRWVTQLDDILALAALTPAPQAEGEALILEEVEAWLSERGLMPRGQYDGAQIATMPTEHDAAGPAPPPAPDVGDLDGLVVRLERKFADFRKLGEDGPDPAPINPDGPEAARALRSLASDRDKAVGLLRQFHTRIMMERRCGGLAVNVAQPIMEATDAFLSRQKDQPHD